MRDDSIPEQLSLWTSSVAASPASPSPASATAGAPPTLAGSGPSSATSLAPCGPATSSSRTCPTSYGSTGAAPSAASSGTWPRSGTMRNGRAFRRAGLGLHTYASASSSSPGDRWPTPVSSDAKAGRRDTARKPGWKSHSGTTLYDAALQRYPTPTASLRTVGDLEQSRYAHGDPRRPGYTAANERLPTPTARDATSGPGMGTTSEGSPNLWTWARDRYPTPTATDWKVVSAPGQRRNTLGDCVRSQHGPGHLNPDLSRWLMGFPIGWTDYARMETLWSRTSPSSSGAASSTTGDEPRER